MSEFQKFLDQALKSIDVDFVATEEHHTSYDVFEEIRTQIINARDDLGMTQKELAAKAGLTQANVSKIEKGVSHPTIETLLKIAAGLDRRLVIRLENSEGVIEYD